jgi:hypothetical protein
MAHVLTVSLNVDDPDRAQDAIDNGTLIPFLKNNQGRIVAEVIFEEDDELETLS